MNSTHDIAAASKGGELLTIRIGDKRSGHGPRADAWVSPTGSRFALL